MPKPGENSTGPLLTRRGARGSAPVLGDARERSPFFDPEHPAPVFLPHGFCKRSHARLSSSFGKDESHIPERVGIPTKRHETSRRCSPIPATQAAPFSSDAFSTSSKVRGCLELSLD